MIIILDTNTYSQWLRDGKWSERIEAASLVMIPTPVLGELREGFLKGNRAELNEKTLLSILENGVVAVAHVSEGTTHHYAKIKNKLRQLGRPIPINDIWIAAIAQEVGGTLLTSDQHFHEVDDLSVIFPEDG